MPITKEELARATYLLKELLMKAEITESEAIIGPLERANDVLGSSLFAKLVTIQNALQQKVEQPIEDEKPTIRDVGQDEPPSFLDEEQPELFLSNSNHPSLSPPPALTDSNQPNNDSILEEELTPAPILPPVPSERTPEDSSSSVNDDSPSITAATRPQSTADNQACTDSLADPRDGLHSLNTASEVKDSPSSVKYLVTRNQDREENDINGIRGGAAIDILSPLRDTGSLSTIKQVLRGKYGRDPRSVVLEQAAEGLGMELVGLRRTGIFISSLATDGVAGACDLLQVGDQILQVNGESTDDLASFEIAYKIEEIPVAEQIALTVIYNPTGIVLFRIEQWVEGLSEAAVFEISNSSATVANNLN